jgi:hypothetical protein
MSISSPYFEVAEFPGQPPRADGATWAARNPYLGVEQMMTTNTPSKAVSRLALAAVALALVCLLLHITSGKPGYGMGTAFGLGILAALVISHDG